MRDLLVVLACLGSAGIFALATALKHRSAGSIPPIEHFTPRALGAFVLATLRHPLWLAGIGADVFGLGLQVVALHFGALSLVQPLLVVAVLFSLAVAHRLAGTRMSRSELGHAVVLVLAVAGFLLVSGALEVREGRPYATSTVVSAVVVVVLVVGCWVAARLLRRHQGGRWSAALYGAAAGVIYACTAALIKAATHVATEHGLLALLGSWQLWVLVVAGSLGLLSAQLAFQAGPLAASLPVTASIDPLASVALALAVFHERLRDHPLDITLSVVALAVMAYTVARLSLERAHLEDVSAAH
ncbi:DMT family transporter [Lapillicoccus jejuensis]|uniref:Magnesium transporter NIPA n=1 Tax=Lapillicoccus jejuensis TaxID=402171 RepID=A0A542E0V6_9MICO|nr:DMT family transporter [Lapillicoccus jejuensis]TQJ08978.1 hypothetical protein FB458_2080 [Lapillicoccus jejuensis]